MPSTRRPHAGHRHGRSRRCPSSTPRWSRPNRATQSEAVEQPAKVMRIGSMIKQLLEEVRQSDARRGQPRAAPRDLRDVGDASWRGAVARPAATSWAAWPTRSPATRRPSEAELRVAKAQLVGWLEGLFHGIQATLFAQQMAARQQLDEMRRRLPPGAAGPATASRGPAPTSEAPRSPLAAPHATESGRFALGSGLRKRRPDGDRT